MTFDSYSFNIQRDIKIRFILLNMCKLKFTSAIVCCIIQFPLYVLIVINGTLTHVITCCIKIKRMSNTLLAYKLSTPYSHIRTLIQILINILPSCSNCHTLKVTFEFFRMSWALMFDTWAIHTLFYGVYIGNSYLMIPHMYRSCQTWVDLMCYSSLTLEHIRTTLH